SIVFHFTHSNPKRKNHGYLDCFTFVRIPFIPSGTSRPSIQVAGSTKPDTWFPVIADDDDFSEESVIDMSHLVEAPAGKYGRVVVDGENLKFANAQTPQKFWALGAGGPKDAKKSAQKIAKWYRKHGVNLVRQHTVLGAVGLPGPDGEFDKHKLDNYDRWFAACKENGIYSTWSIIYPHHGAMLQKGNVSDALYNELYKNTEHANGGIAKVNDYININRELQDWVLTIFKKLLNHKNPYTGMAYKDDPALMVVEAQNESCVFWHSLNSLLNGKMPILAAQLRKDFFQAMKKKYGSEAKLKAAWDGKLIAGDKWAQGELALMGAYHWGADGPAYEFKGAVTRTSDFIRFLYDMQAEYYERRKKELRAIGYDGIYVTTAWQGPGASVLANLKSDTVGDLIDRHNYFAGGDGGHEIKEGKVENTSQLLKPGSGILSTGMNQVENMPFTISEWSVLPPSPIKVEGAPLMALYGVGLQGWDISYHFATGGIARMGDGWPNNGKYCSHTPHYMGQFPALAFAIYNGHIKEGAVVAARQASDAQVFSGKDSLGLSTKGYDLKVMGKGSTPLTALAVGKVTVGFDG
ncbi:MAG: hypothetical protein HRU15_08100, partial [Planctomycetes bacterium]|nr:hypothetical protein [Planctomycetota bacterium]